MLKYAARRFLLTVPVLLGVSVLAFLIIYAAPGDFLDLFRLTDISREQLEEMSREFGLDQPFVIQYGRWLGQILSGSLGLSWGFGQPVAEVLMERVGFTLLLGVITTALSWGIAIPVGVYVALRKDRVFSQIISAIVFVGMCIPEFFLAFLWRYIASYSLVLPGSGIRSPDYIHLSVVEKLLDKALHLAAPVAILTITKIGPIVRLMRGQLLEQLKAEYVAFARAKGIPERVVIRKHAIRNAFNPLVTNLGFVFAGLISGSIFVETILDLPGLGSLMHQAAVQQDVFLTMGALLMSAIMLIAGNLIADLILAWLDPRIRFELAK